MKTGNWGINICKVHFLPTFITQFLQLELYQHDFKIVFLHLFRTLEYLETPQLLLPYTNASCCMYDFFSKKDMHSSSPTIPIFMTSLYPMQSQRQKSPNCTFIGQTKLYVCPKYSK
jgi:hypothetical protein